MKSAENELANGKLRTPKETNEYCSETSNMAKRGRCVRLNAIVESCFPRSANAAIRNRRSSLIMTLRDSV